MHSLKQLSTVSVFVFLVFLLGCSGGTYPVIPESPDDLNRSAPIDDITDCIASSYTGIMGVYELIINPDLSTELISHRQASIGEDFIVSVLGFFAVNCTTCLRVKSVSNNAAGGVTVEFRVRHPFQPGDPGLPPTGINRLDLDLFDMAMIIRPEYVVPTEYTHTGVSAYSDFCIEPDGYTCEIEELSGDRCALPYFLVIDDSETGTSTWNKFEMGSSHDFIISFAPGQEYKHFSLYLTTGYGASAQRPQRLDPKYYNPEFNRKAPWKVDVTPMGNWLSTENTTVVDIKIEVYDWQIGATVYPDPDNFENAPVDNVYSASEITNVSVEIPGMNSSLLTTSTADIGTGMPDDPLVYTVQVSNENLLPAGTYKGLVKVTDERPCLPPSQGRDFLIHSRGEGDPEYYEMPEYSTYQTFDAIIEQGCVDYCWTRTWGGPEDTVSYSIVLDDTNNLYIAGYFYGPIELDPDGGELRVPIGSADCFLTKFDSQGNWLWARTWGGTANDYAREVDVDSTGNVSVVGHFASNSCHFDPDGGGTINSNGTFDGFISKFTADGSWIGTKTWGGTERDYCYSHAIDSSDNAVIAGHFEGTIDLNPDGGDAHTSYGGFDSYILSLDSSGNWRWGKTWGGTQDVLTYSLALNSLDDACITGEFSGTADFRPAGGVNRTSNGLTDGYLIKFNSSGNYGWVEVWGGSQEDTGYSVTMDNPEIIYVTGYFSDTVDFKPGGGDVHTSAGDYDAYLSKFDSGHTWQWTRTWGGLYSADWPREVRLDNSGNPYITGGFDSDADFDPDGGGTLRVFGTGEDVFLTKFDPDGNWQWAKSWGGSDVEIGMSLVLDSLNNTYITGYFFGHPDFDPDESYDWHVSNGGYDAFLTKMNY